MVQMVAEAYAESIMTNPADYQAFVINGVVEETDDDGTSHCEVNNEQPAFFSVYAMFNEQLGPGVDCVGDFPTLDGAREYARDLSQRFGYPIIDQLALLTAYPVHA